MAPEEQLQPCSEVNRSHLVPLDVIEVVFRFADKETLAHGAVLCRHFRYFCQRLLFFRIQITDDESGEQLEQETRRPNGLRCLLGEPDLEVRGRLIPYVREVQLGRDYWMGQEGGSILLPSELLADLAELPNLKSLHFSWTAFEWITLNTTDLDYLRLILSRLEGLRFHQAGGSPFPISLYPFLPNIKRLDLIDLFPYLIPTDAEVETVVNRILSSGSLPTSTFPPLNYLAATGAITLDRLIDAITLDPRNDLSSLQHVHITYQDYNLHSPFTGEILHPTSAPVGRFLRSFGRSLTSLKLTIDCKVDVEGVDLASIGCCSALISLTHLEVTFDVDLHGDTLDIAECPQRWFLTFLMALPVKSQLSKLHLTYKRLVKWRNSPQPSVLELALHTLLTELGACLQTWFTGLTMVVLDFNFIVMGNPQCSWPQPIRLSTSPVMPLSIDKLGQRSKIIVNVPGFLKTSG